MKTYIYLASGCAMFALMAQPALAACSDEIEELSLAIESTDGAPAETGALNGDDAMADQDAADALDDAQADQDPAAMDAGETGDGTADPRASAAEDAEEAQEGVTTAPGEELGAVNDAETDSSAVALEALNRARSLDAEGDEEGCMEAVEEAREAHEAL